MVGICKEREHASFQNVFVLVKTLLACEHLRPKHRDRIWLTVDLILNQSLG